MKNHNHIIDSMLMIVIALLLAAGALTSCAKETEASPIVCTDYDAYKTTSTTLINRSASIYSAYMQGRLSYDKAELRTAIIYRTALLKLSCNNIEESKDVLTIIRNTRDAIPAGKLSDPAIANMYIDDAFNRINELNTNWGWEI